MQNSGLTSFAEDEQVYHSIKAGALGSLLKEAAPKEILNAIKIVNQGESLMDSVIARNLMNEIQRESDLSLIRDPLSDSTYSCDSYSRKTAAGKSNPVLTTYYAKSKFALSGSILYIVSCSLHVSTGDYDIRAKYRFLFG